MYSVYIVLASVLVLGGTARAQSTMDHNMQGMDHSNMTPEQMQAMNESTPALDRVERRTERRAMIATNIQDRIINLTDNVSKRLTAVIERFTNISTRLESRMVKLEAIGVDTTLARAKLNEAKTSLQTAQETLNNLPSVRGAISGDTPREGFTAIRTQFMSVREALRKTHMLLGETITLLENPSEVTTDTTASTTTATTTEAENGTN